MTSAINLLSNRESENQKVSVFKGFGTLISTFCLFPLDGSRGLGRHIVEHTVDAGDLRQDPVGDLGEEGVLTVNGAHGVPVVADMVFEEVKEAVPPGIMTFPTSSNNTAVP